MADLSPRRMAYIRSQYPELHDALIDIVNSVNNLGTQTNAAPVGVIETPTPHSGLSVLGGGGIMDVAITDNSPQNRGREHFFDYSTDGFKTFHTKSMGPAKNWRGALGNGTFQVRSYPSYATSAPAEPLYHSTDVVTTGGAEPPMQAGQGSGTGDAGYGQQPYNTDNPPIR